LKNKSLKQQTEVHTNICSVNKRNDDTKLYISREVESIATMTD